MDKTKKIKNTKIKKEKTTRTCPPCSQNLDSLPCSQNLEFLQSKNIKKDEEIKELKELSEKYLNNWKRAEADFLNYKKEESVRIKDYIYYSQKKIILDILGLLDIILLAESHIPDNLKEDKWVLGLLQIKGQINNLLNNYNVKEIESLDKMVDFNFHEVLQEVETKDKKGGIIINEIQKGYILNGKVIRPARVIIAK